MFKRIQILGMLLVSLWSFNAVADDYSDAVKSFKSAKATHVFFKSAYGYALFPTVGKGGFGVGGSYGEGKTFVKGQVTGQTSLAAISIGFQLGGQAFSEIIFFKDKRAYIEFTTGDFEFGATASAVAVTAGASASAGTTGNHIGASGGKNSLSSKANYHNGMATFTVAKGGLMYEAAISGQSFSFEQN